MGNDVNIGNSQISLAKAGVILVFILSVGWGFVAQVVLPLNSLLVGVAQINATLADNKQQVISLSAAQLAVDARTTLLENQVKLINAKLGIK